MRTTLATLDTAFMNRISLRDHIRKIHFLNPKTRTKITQSQIDDENKCKICYVQLTSLAALKMHIISSHIDHKVNEKNINCPECNEKLPENRIAIHLEFCNIVDSATGKSIHCKGISNSSGFFEIDDRNQC
jgi:hypothetical protein